MDSVDKLTIDTPEQTVLEYPLAGLGSRFLAVLGDMAIQFILFIVVTIAGSMISAGLRFFTEMSGQWVLAVVLILYFLLYSGYYAIFEMVWNGQTPGKRYAKIRVIRGDGRPVSAYESIVRNVVRIVDFMPGFYGVGLVSMMISRENKRLGDFAAGTVVVHEKTMEGVRPYTGAKIDETLPPIDASVVTLEEIQLIEAFLNRRDSLEVDVRNTMAMQITNRLAAKMNVKIYGWPRTERFLEAVMENCRQTDRFRS